MVDLSGIASGSASSSGDSSKTTEKKRTELGQGDFLKLMTTQLKNQDPMSPMDNKDFMAQMAQFTSASGIQDLNSSFKSFAQSMQKDQALRASSLVGHDVVVDSDSGRLPQDGTLDGTVTVPQAVDNLTVAIVDAAGQTVRKLDLGGQPAGQASFSWNGLNGDGQAMPSGTYKIAAQTSVNGSPVSLKTQAQARVNSISMSGAGESPRLNLEGLGQLSLSAVRQVK